MNPELFRFLPSCSGNVLRVGVARNGWPMEWMALCLSLLASFLSRRWISTHAGSFDPFSLCASSALGIAFVEEGTPSSCRSPIFLTLCPRRRSGGCTPERTTTTTTTRKIAFAQKYKNPKIGEKIPINPPLTPIALRRAQCIQRENKETSTQQGNRHLSPAISCYFLLCCTCWTLISRDFLICSKCWASVFW